MSYLKPRESSGRIATYQVRLDRSTYMDKVDNTGNGRKILLGLSTINNDSSTIDYLLVE